MKVTAIEESVLANEFEGLDGQSAVRDRSRLAADEPQEAVGDGVALHGSSRELDMRAGMAAHVVGLQHAQRCEHPAEPGVALIERIGDRQGVAVAGAVRRRDCHERWGVLVTERPRRGAAGGEPDEQEEEQRLWR